MHDTSEYAALRSGALIVDRSDRVRIRFGGPRAAELVTGLVTNDVLALQPGHGQYAAALTPKGKIAADIRIFADADGLLTDTSARADVSVRRPSASAKIRTSAAILPLGVNAAAYWPCPG